MTRNILISACLLIAGLLLSVPAAAQTVTKVKNWSDNAGSMLMQGEALLGVDGAKAHKYQRCIKLNNYVCMKQVPAIWNGSVGQDGDNHTAFSHPKFSLRAKMRDLCSKKKRYQAVSALAVAERYSPWCDTLGSGAVRKGWAKSCEDGARPPENHAGPVCQKPENGVPSDEQCRSCNCPDRIARQMVRGLTDRNGQALSINADMELFGPDGQIITDRMKTVLSNQVYQEVGALRPTDALLAESLAIAGVCR